MFIGAGAAACGAAVVDGCVAVTAPDRSHSNAPAEGPAISKAASDDATNPIATLVRLTVELTKQWQTEPPTEIKVVTGLLGELLTVAEQPADRREKPPP